MCGCAWQTCRLPCGSGWAPTPRTGFWPRFDQVKYEWTEQVMTIAVERFERRLAEEMSAMRAAVAEQGAALRAEMATGRTEIVRWLFLFWTGQVVALAALLAALR